jgi:hypothetical protein
MIYLVHAQKCDMQSFVSQQTQHLRNVRPLCSSFLYNVAADIPLLPDLFDFPVSSDESVETMVITECRGTVKT